MYQTLADAAAVTQNECFLGFGTRIWYARPPTQEDRDAKRYGTQVDLRMGHDWLEKERPALLASLRHADLDKTHALVGEMGRMPCDQFCDSLEAVYVAMQGCAWSPQGEARNLIEAAGLAHTSMSVGDIIEIQPGGYTGRVEDTHDTRLTDRTRRFLVNGVGFVELKPDPSGALPEGIDPATCPF